MPRGDKTGPEGQGQMTGRGMGFCTGYPSPGYSRNIPGRGLGQGFRGGMGYGFQRGRGQGIRRSYYEYPQYSAPTKEQELDALKTQAEDFNRSLGEIQKRISELEGNNS